MLSGFPPEVLRALPLLHPPPVLSPTLFLLCKLTTLQCTNIKTNTSVLFKKIGLGKNSMTANLYLKYIRYLVVTEIMGILTSGDHMPLFTQQTLSTACRKV